MVRFKFLGSMWVYSVCLVTQWCPILCDLMDCGPPGSSDHGILQARILEWVAIPFSREQPNPGIKPRSPALQADSLPSDSPEKCNPWVGKIPWRRKWQPTPVLLPRKSHGQRSLAGYSSLGHKELDTTKQLIHI